MVLYSARAVEVGECVAVQRKALTAADPWVRRRAAGFLGRLGPNARDAIEDLTALAKDKDEGVRDEAARALKRIRAK
jgi:HEAT repeat protein